MYVHICVLYSYVCVYACFFYVHTYVYVYMYIFNILLILVNISLLCTKSKKTIIRPLRDGASVMQSGRTEEFHGLFKLLEIFLTLIFSLSFSTGIP